MNVTRSNWFLILVMVQAAHSLEEYFGELWDVFPPAEWLTSMVSDDRHLGFVIINVGLFLAGLTLWILFVKPERKPFEAILWFWIVLELTNGIGHTAWSIYRASYEPGLITAPFLFITAMILLRLQLRAQRNAART